LDDLAALQPNRAAKSQLNKEERDIMALKGTSGSGKSKAGRPSRPTGGSPARSGSSPKFSGSSGTPPKSSSSWSSGKSSGPSKSFSGKQPAKPYLGGGSSGGGNRMLWLILGALVLLALCCICSVAIAWTYGDSAMDLLRQLPIQ
jgi:hypothetical protein